MNERTHSPYRLVFSGAAMMMMMCVCRIPRLADMYRSVDATVVFESGRPVCNDAVGMQRCQGNAGPQRDEGFQMMQFPLKRKIFFKPLLRTARERKRQRLTLRFRACRWGTFPRAAAAAAPTTTTVQPTVRPTVRPTPTCVRGKPDMSSPARGALVHPGTNHRHPIPKTDLADPGYGPVPQWKTQSYLFLVGVRNCTHFFVPVPVAGTTSCPDDWQCCCHVLKRHRSDEARRVEGRFGPKSVACGRVGRDGPADQDWTAVFRRWPSSSRQYLPSPAGDTRLTLPTTTFGEDPGRACPIHCESDCIRPCVS